MTVAYPSLSPTPLNVPKQSETYRSAATLVLCLTVAFVLGIVFDALGVGLAVTEAAFFPDFAAKETAETAAETALALSYFGIGLLIILTYLTTVVLYCFWVHGANRNARALGAEDMKFTPGWCVGWFFIPVANLFKPFQAVREIYRAADPGAGGEDWKRSAVPSFVGLWWGAWITANILGRLDMRVALNRHPSITQYSGWISAFSGALDIAAAVLALMVVRAVHARLEARAARQKGLNPAVGGP